MFEHFPGRTWAEIDVDALIHNIRKLREITNPATKIMAVVKADAYGHGADFCARVLCENGADMLGVSTMEEAHQLRSAGITAPILILGYIDKRHCSYVVSEDITTTVFSSEFAKALSKESEKQKKPAKIHIKLDTGMGRIGFTSADAYVEEIKAICSLPGLVPEGIFTHFSSADEDGEYTRTQFSQFLDMLSCLEKEGITFPIRHACNSAGSLGFPEMHLDMVRAGIILYGLPAGTEKVQREWKDRFSPVMTLKTSLVQVKEHEKGESIGYGRTYFTKRKSLIGTIPVGYADGYSRRLSNRTSVLIHGEKAPVVGNICMDQSMIDLTDFKKKPKTSEEAVLFGKQKTKTGQVFLPAEEVAELMGTIHYELTCLVGKRITRIYLENEKVVHMFNAIW